MDQAKIQIANYKEQQNNVRNNREFESISKEIEYQELEIELAEKRLKEYAAGVKAKKAQLEKEKQIRQELKARRKKRRREEREYALKELAADGKNALNETVSSLLSAASPSTDIASLTNAGGMISGEFSGMEMGSIDILA